VNTADSILTPWAQWFLGYGGDEDAYNCTECLAEGLPPDDIPPHTIDGKTVCRECTPRCTECSEFIDDNSPAYLGPTVRFRRSELDGKLSGSTHAFCAVMWLLALFSQDFHFDFESATKEQIDVALKSTPTAQRRVA
jgi:hypothetical protein